MIKEIKGKMLEIINIVKEEKPKKNHTKSKKYDFLLSAKNLYLTYSNCNLELAKIIEILREKLSSYIVENWIIVKENHKSGEEHVHVYLKTLKKTHISSSTFLDLQYELDEYHENYQSARKPNAVIEYMLKNISLKSDPNLLYSEGMSNLIGELGNYKDIYESLIDMAEEGKIEEAMELLKKVDPKVYIYKMV